MFRRILVPVDLTAKNLRAVRAAARMAASSKARTTLLHVIERIDSDLPGGLEGFYRKLEQTARVRMKLFASEFEKRGLPVRAQILYGNRVSEILRFATESRTDLIVMSSHKLPLRKAPATWGTISYKVGILSRCPVLLVR